MSLPESYVMTDIRAFGFADDLAFTKYLVSEIGVAAVPGSSFYRDPRDGRNKYGSRSASATRRWARRPSGSANQVDLDVNGNAIRSLIKTLVDHHVRVTSTMAGWERFVPCRPEAIQRVLDVLSESDRKFYEAGRLLDRKKMTVGSSREKELCERLTRMLKKEMEFERAFVRAGGLLLAGADGVCTSCTCWRILPSYQTAPPPTR